MSLAAALKPSEILAVAVKAEIDAASIYIGLQGRVKNEVLVQKLKFLAHEEERHRAMLERLFADRFPGQELKVPDRPDLPLRAVSIDEKSSVMDLFKLALRKEKQAEEFYRDSRKTMEDEQSRKILDYLSRVERSHYFMIKSEIGLLEKFPDYYNVEDFHVAQDLFHIGP
jgi:rubrerythrin